MDIRISNASNRPIYEQIVDQIQEAIMLGTLKAGDPLPSIRALASDLRVSVITTKRAYTELEASGFIDTVAGKGSFVAGENQQLLHETKLRSVEAHLSEALAEAKVLQLSLEQIHEMVDLLYKDE